MLVAGDPLPQISHAENSVEGLSAPGIIRTQQNILGSEKSDAGTVAILFWKIVVQKLRTTLILANLDVAIIGDSRHQTVVSYLVRVVSSRAPRLIHFRNSFGICALIARVLVSGQSKRIGDPFSKMPRPVSFGRVTFGRKSCDWQFLRRSSC